MAEKVNEEFELWKKYEEIAMHFNDLIIQLRIRALGGLAVITTLVGFISKGETSEDFRWGFILVTLCLLILIWVAIWILDGRYYGRLLKGAVDSIKELEIDDKLKTENGFRIRLSTNIEKAVHKNKETTGIGADARVQFYVLVLLALIAGTFGSLYEFKNSKRAAPDTGLKECAFWKHSKCAKQYLTDSTIQCNRDSMQVKKEAPAQSQP